MQRLLGAGDCDEGIAIAIAANPRSKRDRARNSQNLKIGSIFFIQSTRDLVIHIRHTADQTYAVIIQSHFDFVAHRRSSPAHLIALPESSDLGGDLLRNFFSGLVGK